MTSIIRAADAGEFLALIPRLTGYAPVRSLVLIPFRRRRTAGVMRFDLPHADPDAFATSAMGLLCRVDDVDGVAIVVYDDHAPQHAALVDACRRRADAGGLDVVDALGVTVAGWTSYLDDRSGPPPASGLDDQHAGVRLPSVPRVRRDEVRRAVAALGDALEVVCQGTPAAVARLDPRSLAAVELLDDVPLLFESALACAADTLDDQQVAALLRCLNVPALRDVGLAAWCHGRAFAERMLDVQLRWQAGDRRFAGPLFLAGDGPRPDSHRLQTALEAARLLAAIAHGGTRAGPLAAAAWLAWAYGNSTHAAAYARRAIIAEPEHGLAHIVSGMANAGHLPAWAFLQDTTGAER